MEAAPYLPEVAYGPEDGAAHWITTEDGLRLRLGVWNRGATRGTVLIFPGRTEYVEKYGETAADFAAQGYAVTAIDWRGQGLADRLHDNPATGHVGRFTDYQHDVRANLADVARMGLPEPYFLLAHSMGGCIGLRALLEGLPVAAVGFTAPMWGIQISGALRPIAWGLSAISRPLRFSHVFALGQVPETYVLRAPFEDNTLTSDPERFARLQAQLTAQPDMALGGPSLHWLNEALLEMRHLHRLPSPEVPVITYMGSNERIVDPARIRARMARWPGGSLHVLPGAEHEVLMERPDLRSRAIDGISALFAEPTAGAARSA